MRRALEQGGRQDLIGSSCDCLIPDQPPKAALDKRRAKANREVREQREGDHIRSEPRTAIGRIATARRVVHGNRLATAWQHCQPAVLAGAAFARRYPPSWRELREHPPVAHPGVAFWPHRCPPATFASGLEQRPDPHLRPQLLPEILVTRGGRRSRASTAWGLRYAISRPATCPSLSNTTSPPLSLPSLSLVCRPGQFRPTNHATRYDPHNRSQSIRGPVGVSPGLGIPAA